MSDGLMVTEPTFEGLDGLAPLPSFPQRCYGLRWSVPVLRWMYLGQLPSEDQVIAALFHADSIRYPVIESIFDPDYTPEFP